MRRMRTRLFLAAAAGFVLSLPARAQVAPTLSGETGLFEITNADTLAAGRFSLALSWSMWPRTAAPLPGSFTLADDPLRYDQQRLGFSVGYGLTNSWEIVVGTGSNRYHADDLIWAGVISGRALAGGFTHTEQDKVRIASKLLLNPRDVMRVAVFMGYSIPTQSKNDVNSIGSYRSDWDFGASFTMGWFTFQSSYFLAGQVGLESPSPGGGAYGYKIPNEWKNAVGIAVPIIPNVLKIIGEVNRVHHDGGTTQPGDYSDAIVGGRFGFGDFTASGAVRIAIDRWSKYGDTPSNFGGLRPDRVGPRRPAAREGQGRRRGGAPAARGAGAPAAAGPRARRRARPGARGDGRRDRARRPSGDLHDGRDPLRRGQEPAHEHRQGHPRRRRPAPQEQPRGDLHGLRLDGRQGKRRPRRPREGPRRGRQGLPHEAARDRRLAHRDRGQGRRRLRGRHPQPPGGRFRHVPLSRS